MSGATTRLRQLVRRATPPPVLSWVHRNRLQVFPPAAVARLGCPRRRAPVSRRWGYDRGTPLDRFYIERFLAGHGGPDGDIRGRVAEIAENIYARRFGGPVERVDVIDLDAGNPAATVVLDLEGAPDVVPAGVFDCVICTQTLLLVYDLGAAMRNLHRMLAAGGVLLLTVPGISKIARDEPGAPHDYWRFTGASVERMCADVFGPGNVEISTFGNLVVAGSFLYGLAAEDLRPDELERHEPDYQLVVAARAVRRDPPPQE